MNLYHFLSEHVEEIITEWVAFAQTQEPIAGPGAALVLQNHAREILRAIALDVETSQDDEQQYRKSRGLAPLRAGTQSAASLHGGLRQADDFSLLQLSAEFRALRATVLRLWLPKVTNMTAATAYEMVRFNEAIDQALAESILTYSAHADHTRELFLAVLGHDLRSPLFTMALAGETLCREGLTPAQMVQAGDRVRRSVRLMKSMVTDLLGYTSTQFGKPHAGPAETCRRAGGVRIGHGGRQRHPPGEPVPQPGERRPGRCFRQRAPAPALHQPADQRGAVWRAGPAGIAGRAG